MDSISKLRNEITFALTRQPHLIPELTDGSRNISVVFLSEKVGPALQQVERDLGGSAHFIVIDDSNLGLAATKIAGTISMYSLSVDSRPLESESKQELSVTMSFGTFLSWVRDCHDGQVPVTFGWDHHGIAVAPASPTPAMEQALART